MTIRPGSSAGPGAVVARPIGRRRGGRSREAMIAMFLAATFGMMALLSIQLQDVLSPIGRLLNPPGGSEAPGQPTTPFAPPVRAPVSGVTAPGTGDILGGQGAPSTSPGGPGKGHHHPHKPPHEPPPPVHTSTDSVVVPSRTITATGSKGVLPPPNPISRPKKNSEEVVGHTDPAPTKGGAGAPDGGKGGTGGGS
jgi:hypothetical protein